MKFGLSINTARESALRAGEALTQWFKERGIAYIVEKDAAKILGEIERCKIETLSENCDVIISLGGDGTLLRVARYANATPILGVNFGRLGFLAEFSIEELYPVIERVLKNNFKTETRTRLEACVKVGKKEHKITALNDVIAERGGFPRLPVISLKIDGHLVSHYKADGLIISTSTGSTAYSMSAGGPIIVPKSKVFVITPICPHVLTTRPIVVSDDKELEISIESMDERFMLNCDGSQQIELTAKDRVRVYKSEKPVYIIENEKRNYYDVLRTKFLWGKDYEK
ncbi:MAG: inorganic polyphosphate kinase [[Candidatus Thermochlorobacteriaceae] bacterium GBChlB]|nr:MAG: inorganic polyphosphate kinase [[Candidatus Thermochlorobacteriaceae] bacterium GBChlB]